MKKKILITIITVLGVAILFFAVATNNKIPVTFESDALLLNFNIDNMIKASDLIIIGEVITTLPARWNGPDGRIDPKNVSPQEIFEARGLFTDSLISINQILKGDFLQPNVRVRSYTGETEKVSWANESEPSYIISKSYVLFLAKDTGATAKIDAGDYVPVGAYQGVYEIVDGEAISKDDKWNLDELIAYVQKSLSSSPSPTSLPETLLPVETTSPTP